jgi:hypothetical protein
MRIYQISQKDTGAILWVGGAETEENALESMAHEAGFRKFKDLPIDLLGQMSVTELSL